MKRVLRTPNTASTFAPSSSPRQCFCFRGEQWRGSHLAPLVDGLVKGQIAQGIPLFGIVEPVK